MFFGRFIRIGTDDFFSRIVGATVAPGCGKRRLVADAAGGPDVGELARRVAAEIARVGPKFLIFVEILGRKTNRGAVPACLREVQGTSVCRLDRNPAPAGAPPPPPPPPRPAWLPCAGGCCANAVVDRRVEGDIQMSTISTTKANTKNDLDLIRSHHLRLVSCLTLRSQAPKNSTTVDYCSQG